VVVVVAAAVVVVAVVVVLVVVVVVVLGDQGLIPGRGKGIFPLTFESRLALGPTQPPDQWVPGVLSSGVKRSRDVTTRIPSSAEVMNE
jgi:hypothetical protein